MRSALVVLLCCLAVVAALPIAVATAPATDGSTAIRPARATSAGPGAGGGAAAMPRRPAVPDSRAGPDRPAAFAGRHGNHVGADAQVTADGTVLIESLFIITDGFLVIHADDGGEMGRPLGHVAVEQGYHRTVTVEVAASAWSGNDTVDVWAVLHADDGDGEFEPEEDDPLRAFGRVAADRFPVRLGAGTAVVAAKGFAAQRTAAAAATIRRAALPERGHLVVRTVTDTGGVGPVVGVRTLAAGSYRNVTVPLDPGYFANGSTGKSLWVIVYRDDGDGTFDSGDRPVRVAGRPVRTRFAIRRVEGNATTTTDEGIEVNTPVSTTPTTTTAPSAPTASPTATAPSSSGSGPTPWPGPLATAVAVAVALAVVARRRRDGPDR